MILVLNCGSQSVKWKIFDENLKLISQGRKEYYKKSLAEKVLRDELKKIKNSDEAIKFIGHRVVHPICELAPLHNPFELLGIKAAKKEFKKAKHLIVFDTDFFKNLPAVSQIYPLPEFLRKKYSIRRFGFHGISHQYLTQKTSEIQSLQEPGLNKQQVREEFKRIKPTINQNISQDEFIKKIISQLSLRFEDENLEKRFACFSFGIPIPVSETEIII